MLRRTLLTLDTRCCTPRTCPDTKCCTPEEAAEPNGAGLVLGAAGLDQQRPAAHRLNLIDHNMVSRNVLWRWHAIVCAWQVCGAGCVRTVVLKNTKELGEFKFYSITNGSHHIPTPLRTGDGGAGDTRVSLRPLCDTTVRRAHTDRDVYLKVGVYEALFLCAERGNLRIWKLTLTRGDSHVASPRPNVREMVRCTKRGLAFVGVYGSSWPWSSSWPPGSSS